MRWYSRNLRFALVDLGKPSWRHGRTFLGDVSEDLFVHFTTRENAEKILETKTLGSGNFSTFAVSTTYGEFFPGVQTTHIGGDDVVAVVFSTDMPPTHGYPEEVVWKGTVPVKDLEIIGIDEAATLLSEAPARIGEDDVVVYDPKNA
jgi:hypothetical protein